uniref:phenylalanyl tRNA synthetase beta subunit n=1 Tax=Haramonas pauciplastida TaxID=478668 RepID=UPI002114E22A|nr:phenylalanyl tRNA synthetase beta subunit [Haramonas pauciplastida]YP_010444174.1 phenylalanyl tRNA synthetase beta subunit [Haramonas pauciplastida]UTE95038.1 phenylalanyl tRNA synthetase beta subunit [Haramonas pauciplastida]UTE95060.1 phenylalanyl tRNA synthetase beta subunit [Haramonas pauciplastida]
MHVSLNWLKTYLNIEELNSETLQNRLILNGFEIEKISKARTINKGDIIFDFSTTANRPDVLSLVGFATEISNLFSIRWKKLPYRYESSDLLNENIENEIDFIGTVFYRGIVVSHIKFESFSPSWLQSRLLDLKLPNLNLFLNLANYTMLELGQPFQLYDYKKILRLIDNPNDIVFGTRFGKSDETFIDSNNKIYNLSISTLLVTVNNIPISIAGGPISLYACIDKDTTIMFIEASIFNPDLFRQSNKSIGFSSNATLFYQRGINKFLVNTSCRRFLSLLSIFNRNLKSTLKTTFYTNFSRNYKKIYFDPKNLESILDFKNIKLDKLNKVTNFEIFLIEIFVQLNLPYNQSAIIDSNPMYHTRVVQIPFTRLVDLDEEIDLFEEICRLIGFNTFVNISSNKISLRKLSKTENLKRRFRKNLLSLGFDEVYHYSLTSLTSFAEIELSNSKIVHTELKNTLLNHLLQTIYNNYKKAHISTQIFEFGRIFTESKKRYIFEFEALAGTFGGLTMKNNWDSNYILNWFNAKGIFEILFKQFSFDLNFTVPKFAFEIAHSKRIFQIQTKRKNIGVFFELNPKFVKKYGLVKPIYLFELNFTKLIKIVEKQKLTIYIPYSNYPISRKDLSLVVPEPTTFSQITKIILVFTNEFLKSFELFDVYKNFDTPMNFKNLGISLEFQSQGETLMRSEIDNLVQKIRLKLKNELNVVLK